MGSWLLDRLLRVEVVTLLGNLRELFLRFVEVRRLRHACFVLFFWTELPQVLLFLLSAEGKDVKESVVVPPDALVVE